MIDIIIIGAGPSGVSAALYAKARGKNILVFEKEKIGGLISNVSKVSHYASVEKDETGPEFAKRLEDQLNYSQIPVKFEEVKKIEKIGDSFKVTTNKDQYTSQKVICACGSSLKELPLNVPKDFSVKHWPLGNEEELKGKTVIINGGSDGASKEALYISKFAKEVHIVQDQDKLMCIDEFKRQIENSENIKVHTSSKLLEINVVNGRCLSAKLTNSEIKDDKGIEIYAQIGQNGNSEILKDFANVNNTFLDEDIISKTSGLFFAGDIRVKPVKQIATAVCDGCLAGINACK